MKKFLLILGFIILAGSLPVMAKNVKVQAMSDFSTENPPGIWNLKIVEGFTTKNGFQVVEGSVLTGKIIDVTDPKRLKRNATFRFIPVSYHDIRNGETYGIDKEIVGKYNSLGDIKATDVIEKGAVTAGNYFISSTIGPGVALVKGAVKNESGNRAKSAVVSVYESTPVSYISKGKELEIKEGQVFLMSFKLQDEEDDEN